MPFIQSGLNADQALSIAEHLIDSGQAQQALQTLLQAYNLYPMHEKIALRLARLLHSHGQNNDALIILNKTFHLGTKTFELGYLLAALLQISGHSQKAEIIIQECLKKEPNSFQANNLLGTTLIEQNRYEEGISAYLKAIELNPSSPDALNNLAWAYRATGEKAEAIHYFERAFDVDPSATEALSGLLMLKNFKTRSAEFDVVESLLDSSSLNVKQKTELEFSLGKAYEDILDYQRAFSHFKHANDEWRHSINYSIKQDEALFSEIKKRFTKDSLSKLKSRSDADTSPQAIFVLGMPRSSTTLIEQIISSHSSVIGGGELPFLDKLLIDQNKELLWPNSPTETDLIKLSKAYQNTVKTQLGNEISSSTRYFTDKLPQNFRFIGAILLLFPNAKIIHCKREPMDTCLSLYKHHFPMSNHHYSYNLEELGQYYKLYDDLMSYWHDIAPGKILDIQYEDLLEDFERGVKDILKYCELPFEEKCLNFQDNQRVVRTASSDQVRQGLYKSAAGRWHKYENELSELKASLASRQSYS